MVLQNIRISVQNQNHMRGTAKLLTKPIETGQLKSRLPEIEAKFNMQTLMKLEVVLLFAETCLQLIRNSPKV